MARKKKHPDVLIDDGDSGKKKRTQKRNNFNYTIKQKITMVKEAYSKPKYVNQFARESGLAKFEFDLIMEKRNL
jgi:hypothetical protein